MAGDHRSMRIDDVVLWGGLPIYGLIWSATLSHGYDPEFLVGSILITAVYLAAHVYEIRCRGHCYLSADSTACPASCLGLLVWGAFRWQVGGNELSQVASDLLPYFGMAFMGAHLVVLFCSSIATTMLGLISRRS